MLNGFKLRVGTGGSKGAAGMRGYWGAIDIDGIWDDYQGRQASNLQDSVGFLIEKS